MPGGVLRAMEQAPNHGRRQLGAADTSRLERRLGGRRAKLVEGAPDLVRNELRERGAVQFGMCAPLSLRCGLLGVVQHLAASVSEQAVERASEVQQVEPRTRCALRSPQEL